MKIFTWNDILESLNTDSELSYFDKGCGISVGSFDGLHKGHRLLLKTLVDNCRKENLLSGIVTFKRPLPSIKHAESYDGDISTLSQRIYLFEELGLDFVIVVDFDESFASMLGSDFFTLLINQCNMKLLAEGVDFRCGYKGATDSQAIKYFGETNNIKTFFVNPVYYKDGDVEERISSSYIRSMIKKGFLNTVSHLLERPFTLDLPLEFQVLPPDGTYFCRNEKNEEVRLAVKKGNLSCDNESKRLIFS